MLSKNVINEVIKEWSWRVPNGMPDVNKSEHLNILRELLIADFGASTYTVNNVIHSLSGEKTDKQEVQEIAMRIEQSKIDDIVNYLTGSPPRIYSGEVINQMHALAARDELVYGDTLAFLTDTVGFPSGPSTVICDVIFSKPEHVQSIVNYLKKRTLKLKVPYNGTISGALTGAGLPSFFIQFISEYNWSAVPSTGKGEAAIALLCKNGGKAKGGGDVTVDGKEVEVKGKGGRLRGFSTGYGNPEEGHKVSMNGLQKLLDKFYKNKKLKKEKGYPFGLPIKAPKHDTAYQLSKNAYKNNMLAKYSPILIQHKIAKPKDFAKIYIDSIKAVFKGSGFKLGAPSVDAEGKITNVATYVDVDWFRAAYKFYFSLSNHDMIAILPGTGKFVVMDVNSDPTQYLKITSRPGFNKDGGTMGATFAIDPK